MRGAYWRLALAITYWSACMKQRAVGAALKNILFKYKEASYVK